MTNRLRKSFLFSLIGLFLGWISPIYSATKDESIWVGPLVTKNTRREQSETQTEQLRSDPTAALGARLIRLSAISESAVRSQISQDTIGPTRIGFSRDVPELSSQQDTENRLDWMLVSGGMVGTLAINSPDSAAIRLGIRVQELPDTAEIRFFSNKSREVKMVSGKTINEIIQLNLKAGDSEESARVYWSPTIIGEVAGLEVFLPQGLAPNQVSISIPKISHLTISPTSSIETLVQQAESASCNLDAMCYPSWSLAGNAVGRMVYSVNGGSYLCTGTLLNDTANSGTPYFLTANHCISSQSAASTLETYWFYHSSACNSGIPYSGIILSPVGSTLLYNSTTTDTSFLRLNNPPPAGVSFAGWTTYTPVVGTASTGLHNPKGDLQKIGFGFFNGFQSCSDSGSSFFCSPATSTTGPFLQILYYQGITEGGSSGSGVFTDNGQYLYGQLKGGNISCSNPNGSTTYGRFDVAFAQGNLGRWLVPAPPPPTTYLLNVVKSGSGTITSVPATISCGSTCSGSFAAGSNVSLFAQPDYGFAFTGWSGACAGTGTCVATMDGNKSVSANFIELPKYPVKITKPSTGVISSEPAGIFCGGPNRQCSSSFSSAKLTATPNPGYEFIRWTGCQAPEGNICYIKPTGKMTVKPVFKKLPKFNLKVTKNNLGSVISSPAGLKCPDKKRSCSVKFIKGTQVTLTAAPQAGRSFVGWTGACSGTDPCAFLMDGNKGVGASFQ